ncbi:MAG TPA: HAMP domain-containing sensor histidine kinase [Spirochaetia bacterium]|nr:HAMP domain-containing sensor histidine kinase [Spirochaetia bacterium]
MDQISRGNLDISIPEKGVGEITRIARSANQLRVQLKREKELRQQWAQDIAHDLRTPISVLKAQFEGMHDGVLDLSLERFERNLNEIARVEHLVSDLEELMVLETPEKKINRVRINARTFLDSLRHTYSYELEKRKIRLECRTDVPVVFADQGMIDRAVSNFMANALRHTPENGTIGVFIERRNGEVAIRVSDTGDGIPSDEIGRVFDRLFRGDHARNSPGSGLGLTIARKIAELHGGSVTIQSRLGAGTTVELLLPFSEEENRENGGTSSGEP